MELKPRSDGRRTKASLPEKKKSSQDDRAAQSAAKRMSLLLNLYRLQGLPKTRNEANSKFLTTRTLKITQTSESEKERLIFRISHGKKIGLRIQVSCNVNYKDITERSSEQGHRVDAKAPFAEEGRD